MSYSYQVSHSPYFVDLYALGPGMNLIYIKKDKEGSSKAFGKPSSSESGHYETKIKSYIFNPNILFSNHNLLVQGASDSASFYTISDSLKGVFERYNIVVINAWGHGHIDPYVKFMTDYQNPYVAMVDSQYDGTNLPSDNFIVLDNKLENELAAAGWNQQFYSSVDPDKAFELIQQGRSIAIRDTKLGKIFDKVLLEIGEDPQKNWMLKPSNRTSP